MKFLHIADCHLGGWRDERLMQLNLQAFDKAIDIALSKHVDFVIIAGDLFDVAVPNMKVVKHVAEKLKQLNEAKIPCYVIAGSHDSSLSGVSIIDVLSSAGLCYNVAFDTLDDDKLESMFNDKPYVIVGLQGKKRNLELENIDEFNNKVNAIKELWPDKKLILVLHTNVAECVDESLTNFVNKVKLSSLPEADYYALGHIHIAKVFNNCCYPGCLFPNSFDELEKIKHGSCCIVELNSNTKIELLPIVVKDVECINIDANNLTPYEITQQIVKQFESRDVQDKIVLLKASGVLKSGKPSEIDLKAVQKIANEKRVFCLLRNFSKLTTKEFETATEIQASNVEEIENKLLAKLKQFDVFTLFNLLNIEKQEGEITAVFNQRLLQSCLNGLKIDNKLLKQLVE